jgi:hypothetical protein
LVSSGNWKMPGTDFLQAVKGKKKKSPWLCIVSEALICGPNLLDVATANFDKAVNITLVRLADRGQA